MAQQPSGSVAWVESPLQLVAAAEWANAHDQRLTVVHRLTGPQMPTTAQELLERSARFATCVPYYGIPWQLLASHRNWVIGDGFSGQFRLAASVLRPDSVTLLDDGALTISLVDALLSTDDFSRPDQRESTPARVLGGLARDRMLGLAARERLEISTAFPLGTERLARATDRGIRVAEHRFDWTRRTARPIALPGSRVLLGSAWPVDGRMSDADYLAWVASETVGGDIAYLPHRRENPATVAAVKQLPGVRVYQMGLPVELVLAGVQDAVEVITLPTSAKTTLRHILRGTGSVIRTRQPVPARS